MNDNSIDNNPSQAAEPSNTDDRMGAAREYHYRNRDCGASNDMSPDCICWYKEGTGPLANSPQSARYWRYVDQKEPVSDKMPPSQPVFNSLPALERFASPLEYDKMDKKISELMAATPYSDSKSITAAMWELARYVRSEYLKAQMPTPTPPPMASTLPLRQHIEMKREFLFDVFKPADSGKHYFAAISYQEGRVAAPTLAPVASTLLVLRSTLAATKASLEEINDLHHRLESRVVASLETLVDEYANALKAIEAEIGKSEGGA